MKQQQQPNPFKDEASEFSLATAEQLRCTGQGGPSGACQECDACQLDLVRAHVDEWLRRAGDQSKRRFVLGLVRRLRSVDLLKQMTSLLQAAESKDSMYARTRYKPALATDMMRCRGDGPIEGPEWESVIGESLVWFQSAGYWTKSNFMMRILNSCDACLLRDVGKLSSVLLESETRVKSAVSEKRCMGSPKLFDVDQLQYEDYPDVNSLLRSIHIDRPAAEKQRIKSGVSWQLQPASNEDGKEADLGIIDDDDFADDELEEIHWFSHDESGDEDVEAWSRSRLDCVSPSSVKSFSGLKKKLDFIRCLPIHLSKYIMNQLDDRSLRRCMLVSPHWKAVADQVYREIILNQQIHEEVMLMQGVTAKAVNPVYAKDIDVPVPNLIPGSMTQVLRYDRPVHRVRMAEPTEETTDEERPKSHQPQKKQSSRDRNKSVSPIRDTSSRQEPRKSPKGSPKGSPKRRSRSASDKCKTKESARRGKRRGGGTGGQMKRLHIYPSECNFRLGYEGVSTRNVVIEERNVYCGPYNVLVLVEGLPVNKPNPSRVLHTNGGKLIALGDADRFVQFIHVANQPAPRVRIFGHAGSIKTLFLCEKRGFVLSGSFDTSIRRWCIKTGQCQKIYRGHMGSVNSIDVHTDYFISGSTDNTCKIWTFDDNKFVRSMKHAHPVTTVAIGDNLCVSGDQSGRVKVWNVRDGTLIKVLIGHSAEVTTIKFDRYHILTGARDGFVLLWSAIGDHTSCIGSLRHPKAVLCMELLFLRAVTGCEDGRLRVWNILSGKCCRIMPGNSRSDPILHLRAIEDRITINTPSNVLALNFEPVKWNYALPNDSVPPLIKFGEYKNAPVRKQPYAYVRGQRLRIGGGTDPRLRPGRSQLIERAGDDVRSEMLDGRWTRMEELFHSSLAMTRVPSATRFLRSRATSGSRPATGISWKSDRGGTSPTPPPLQATDKLQIKPPQHPTEKARKSSPPAQGFPQGRRLSYGFERPIEPQSGKDVSLGDVKSLLRSQLRDTPREASRKQPDYVKLTVSALRSATNQTLEPKGVEKLEDARAASPPKLRRLNRPSSSPCRIDPRQKAAPEETLEAARGNVIDEDDGEDEIVMPLAEEPRGPRRPLKEMVTIGFETVQIRKNPQEIIHSSKFTRTTIPSAGRIRPHTATTITRPPATPVEKVRPSDRVQSASATSVRQRPRSAATTVIESRMTPMLMYHEGMLDGLRVKKEAFNERLKSIKRPAGALGQTMSGSGDLILRTNQQSVQHMKAIADEYRARELADEQKEEKRRRKRWLELAKGQQSSEPSSSDRIKRPSTAV